MPFYTYRFLSECCVYCYPCHVQYDLSVWSQCSFLSSPSHSLLCSVLLWACASTLQTLLKSLSGSILPSSDNPFSSDPFCFFSTLHSSAELWADVDPFIFYLCLALKYNFYYFQLIGVKFVEPTVVSLWWFSLRPAKDKWWCKWKQILALQFHTQCIWCFFAFFMYIFLIVLHLLVAINYKWVWDRSGLEECGQKAIRWQMR